MYLKHFKRSNECQRKYKSAQKDSLTFAKNNFSDKQFSPMKPSLIVLLAEFCATISLKFIDEFLDQIHGPCQTFFFGQHWERCAMFSIVQLDNVIDANCRVGVAYIKTTT